MERGRYGTSNGYYSESVTFVRSNGGELGHLVGV